MKQKERLLIILIMFGGGLALQAQEVISSSGGNVSGSGGSVSYSVGQVVYTTNTGTNGSVAQGVQQPYEISVVTGIEEATNINLIYLAFDFQFKSKLLVKIKPGSSKNCRRYQPPYSFKNRYW